MPDPHGEDHILRLLDGFIESKVLMTAFQLGVFELLAEAPLPEDQILEHLELPRRSGTILLNACRALDLLESGPEGLRTAEPVRPFLRRGPEQPFRLPTYLIGFYDHVYGHLSALDDLVRSDGHSSTFALRPYFKEPARIASGEASRYTAYMAETVVAIAEVALETVDFAPSRSMLDLGGGTGELCQTIARRHPQLHASFLDVPAVVALARPPEDAALAARVRGLPGDMFQTTLPQGLDLITLCRCAHDWGESAIEGVFRRAFEALDSGGRLMLIERMLPDSFDPEARALYLRSLYFLLKSPDNEYRTPDWYHGLLRRVGFARVTTHTPARDPNRFFKGLKIVVATRD